MQTRVRKSIIDSHVHFLNSDLNYHWAKDIPALNKAFLPSDLKKDAHSVAVESIIFVQADCDPKQAMAEVAWVTELSKHHPEIRGIIAHVPLEQGNAIRQQLVHLQKNPLVKGVRRLLQSEENEFFLQSSFIEGVRMLADFGLSFDICVKAAQLHAVTKLVALCPQVKFILDHLGKPNVAENQFATWQHDITKLAALPNVHCKISGLITEANHQTWQIKDIKPYILHAIDAFGIQRTMFGSDWPVVNLAGTYARWITALDTILSAYPEKDVENFFNMNSDHCYRLTNPMQKIFAMHSFYKPMLPIKRVSVEKLHSPLRRSRL